MTMGSLNNFSKLLGHDNARTAAMEAKQEILHKAVDSQEVGWGALEAFLLKLCSLFSERCKDVDNALTNIQRALVQDPNILNDKNQLSLAVSRLYLAAEVYRQIGATLHYQVDVRDDRARLMLSGELNNPTASSSLWQSEDLDYELEISRDQAAVLKVLAGDVSLPECDVCNPDNPVANEERINECFDFSQLTENQSKLLKKLASMKEADVQEILKAVQEGNRTLGIVSNQIKHIRENNSDMMQLDYKLFRDMYRNTENHEIIPYSDFLDVLPAFTAGVNQLERRTTLFRGRQAICERMATIDTEIKNINDEIKNLIKKETALLKDQICNFATDLSTIFAEGSVQELSQNTSKEISQDTSEEISQDISFEYNDSGKDFKEILKTLPKSFREQFNNCLKFCEESESQGTKECFEAAANSVSHLVNDGIRIAREKLTAESAEKEKNCQKKIRSFSEEINKLETRKTRITASIGKLEGELNKSTQQLDENSKEIQFHERKSQLLREQLQNFTELNREDELKYELEKKQIAEVSAELNILQEQQKAVEEEWCNTLNRKQYDLNQMAKAIADREHIHDSVGSEIIPVSHYAIRTANDLKNNGLAKILEDLQDGKQVKDASYLEYDLEYLHEKEQEFKKRLGDFIKTVNYKFNQDVFKDEAAFLEEIKKRTFFIMLDDKSEDSNDSNNESIKITNDNNALHQLISRINSDGVKDFLKKYEKAPTLPHRIALTDRAKKENDEALKQAQEDAQERYELFTQYLTEDYLVNHNFFRGRNYNRLEVFRRKRGVIKAVIRTVVSLDYELKAADENYRKRSDVDVFNSGEIVSENVRQAITGINEWYKKIAGNLSDQLAACRSIIDNLKQVLPSLMDYTVKDAEAGAIEFGDTKFSVNNLHVDLDDQAQRDIQWVLDYIGNNYISVVGEYSAQNFKSINEMSAVLRELKEKRKELYDDLNNIAGEYTQKLHGIDGKLSDVKAILAQHELSREALSKVIEFRKGCIADVRTELSGKEEKIKSLKEEKSLLERKIEETKQKISTQEEKYSSCNRGIIGLGLKINGVNAESSHSKFKSRMKGDQIDDLEKHYKDKCKNNIDEDVTKLNDTLKQLGDGLTFLDKSRRLIESSALDEWVRTGNIHSEGKTDYRSVFMEQRIPKDANKEELMELWASSEYNVFSGFLSESQKKAVSDNSEIMKNLVRTNGSENVLDEIQADSFNELFDTNKNNKLINDVYGDLETFCKNNSEPDINFKLFSKYVGHQYNALKNYKQQVAMAPAGVKEEMQALVANLEDKLYKAQMVFGIYISVILSNNTMVEQVRNKTIGNMGAMRAGVIGRDLMQLLSGIVAPSVVSNKFMVDDADFRRLVSQSNDETESQKEGWAYRFLDWIMGDNDEMPPVGKAVSEFVIRVLNNQRTPVALEMSTGRVIASQKEVFAEPSLSPLMVYGVPNNVEGADFLLCLTDISGGAVDLVGYTFKGVTNMYFPFFKKRANWVKKHPEYQELASDACSRLNLRGKIKQQAMSPVSAVA